MMLIALFAILGVGFLGTAQAPKKVKKCTIEYVKQIDAHVQVCKEVRLK